MSSFKSFVVFAVAVVLAVVSAAAAVQPFHSTFLTKAACTLAVATVIAATLWISSPASPRRKAKIMVLVAITFLALSAESCDSGSSTSSGGNGCWTSLVEKNGQLVCPEKAQPIEQVIVNESIKSAQQAYDKAVDKAASAYGQAVQGSMLQQSVGALQNAGAIKRGKD